MSEEQTTVENQIGASPSTAPGVRTTEFWITLITALAPLWTQSVLPDDVRDQLQSWIFIASGIATAVYTAARSIVKVVESRGRVAAQEIQLQAIKYGVGAPVNNYTAQPIPVSHPAPAKPKNTRRTSRPAK